MENNLMKRGDGMINANSYQAKQFDLSGLNGISDRTLEMHFKLYEGYVKETNNLSDRISEFLKDGKVDQEEVPAYSELTRRLGFEYNGMVLHSETVQVIRKRTLVSFLQQKRALAATTSGRRILLASARCAASVGPFVTRILPTDDFPIIGSRFMKQATWRDSIRYW
jgi:hypothetical protein